MVHVEVRNLYAGAVAYADGASLISNSGLTSTRQALVLPTHTLLGMSLELGHKAIYTHLGGNPKILKQVSVRHNLAALQQLCADLGFKSNIPQVEQIICAISQNYANHDYRYMKPDLEIAFVDIVEAIPVTQKFVDEVAAEVGLPPRPEPTESY